MKDSKLKKLLTNSIWIVPTETLLAYETINNITKPVNDQTVWVIDSYKDGYVFGTSYTAIDKNPSSKTKIIGSITPEGKVEFAFHSNTITNGSGEFKKIHHEYQFIMQMNSLNTIGQGVIGLSHWSYMKHVTPRDYEYYHLPGINISVPEFIKMFN